MLIAFMSNTDSFFELLVVLSQVYKAISTGPGGPKILEDGIYDAKNYFLPWDDYIHYPNQVRDTPFFMNPQLPPSQVNGSTSTVPPYDHTPDFRISERDFPVLAKSEKYKETGRYYRLHPNSLYTWYSNHPHQRPYLTSCYCVTTYKRLTPLGMGAVLTYRHLLTTALSTDIVVSKYRNKKTLENILGAWYQSDFAEYLKYSRNVSYYMTPARIIYHPLWNPPEKTNRSHPIPSVYDLALWTSTFIFFVHPDYWPKIKHGPFVENTEGLGAALCNRWSNKQGQTIPPLFWHHDIEGMIVGCQMVMDINRVPFPWFRYAVKLYERGPIFCPKTEWDWFLCITWHGPHMKYGVEPGAALHVGSAWEKYVNWQRYPGLAGLNSFTMKLRSKYIVNYFTVLDRYPVLEYLYDAIKGRLPYAYLDWRFMSERDKDIRLRPDRQYINIRHPYPQNWFTKYSYMPIWY